jgi:hypothetical protein
MHVYTYIHAYTHIYVYIHTYMHVCVIYIYIYIYIYTDEIHVITVISFSATLHVRTIEIFKNVSNSDKTVQISVQINITNISKMCQTRIREFKSACNYHKFQTPKSRTRIRGSKSAFKLACNDYHKFQTPKSRTRIRGSKSAFKLACR